METGIFYALKEWWHVITGMVIAIGWGLVRIKRSITSAHPTHAELDSCKEDVHESLVQLLADHERTEFKKLEEQESLNNIAHERIHHKLERLEDRISDMTKELLETIRGHQWK